jgi:hypothetical protein
VFAALRVEWCKAYSRLRRWQEELVMVEEEMRRTIDYGSHAEQRWKVRATARASMLSTGTPISPEVAEGARAYALEYADRERRTTAALELDWVPIRARGAMYLRGEDISHLQELVITVD